MENIVHFDFNSNPNDTPKIIKVIGVGGGGGNAVKHMYQEGIHDVTFALCNTDLQALRQSEIPVKIQLGPKTTQGLGAGNDPKVAREAAEESIEEIRNLLNDGTQMVFVTAGMGGGTGTGAAPVVARIAKEMDKLTVGIVTIPFLFERNRKIMQALEGVEEMQKNVDALLVINNERLREIYTDGITTMREAFAKADDILSVATKSIAEMITMEGNINLDFRDVKKILKNGGVAIMSTGIASGERRLKHAIDDALKSPLLNDNDISKAKKILFNISWSKDAPLLIEETNEIDSFMESLDKNIEVIWGEAEDPSLLASVHPASQAWSNCSINVQKKRWKLKRSVRHRSRNASTASTDATHKRSVLTTCLISSPLMISTTTNSSRLLRIALLTCAIALPSTS